MNPTTTSGTGPLSSVRVVEIAGIGPVPHAAMLLAGMGASVIRVDRAGGRGGSTEIVNRGRPSVVVDLKSAAGQAVVRRLADRADVVMEGMRPGSMERLGLGPDELRRFHPSLVYARMTGWGQHGPLSAFAGHDINFIALSGALDQFRRAGERPVPPMNLVGDYGGGSMLLVVGILAATLRARETGNGDVVDVAMVDGIASMLSLMLGRIAQGTWGPPGTNTLDTGAPFYDVYTTGDGRHIAVGAIEAPFYRQLLEGLGLDEAELPDRHDHAAWPALRAIFRERFASRTLGDWTAVFRGTDACVTPVLTVAEAEHDPHLAARDVFVRADGVLQPGIAPRFANHPTGHGTSPSGPGGNPPVLTGWGFDEHEVARLVDSGTIA